MSGKHRAYCFTWNNYTEDDVSYLKTVDCQYIVFGFETAPTTGTPHLQGYIYFSNPRSFEAVRKNVFKQKAHIIPAAGDALQNYDYATKGGEFYEQGAKPQSDKERGAREKQRFDDARKAAVEGRFTDIPSDIYIRYYGAFKRMRVEDAAVAPATEIVELRPWQEALRVKLTGPVDSRKVLWFTDFTGGQGKTEFAKWAVVNLQAHIVHNAKTADIAYGLPTDPRIVIFDYTRSMEGHVNYGILEAVKNGMVFSSKYESRMKCFTKPHVVVFSNFEPDLTKLSADRWDVTNL